LRFEVKYPSGQPHEVELSGTVAVLGRDPSCDLVLNDARCSRRHAVLEAGPQGVSVRDAGSANGIYVNGKKVERSPLVPGDVVRLGEVFLKILPEEVVGTVVMAPEDLEAVEHMHKPIDGDRTASVPPTPVEEMAPRAPAPPPPPAPAPAPPPPPPPAPAPSPAAAGLPRLHTPPPSPSPSPAPRAPRPPTPSRAASAPPPARAAVAGGSGGPIDRPLTVTVLAGLWMIGVLYYPAVTILSLRQFSGVVGYAVGAVGVLATLVSALMAWGLWARQAWARFAQAAFCILGILTCVFAPACGTILAYLFRADVSSHFSDKRPEGPGAGEDGKLEPFFAAAVVGLVVLPILLSALVSLVGAFAGPTAATN
jgi:hypothetical protein